MQGIDKKQLGGMGKYVSGALTFLGLVTAMTLTSSPSQAQNWTEREVTGGASDPWAFPTSTWFCALTGVKGYFGDHDRSGGHEYVEIANDGDFWRVHAGNGRTGRMACTRWSNFSQRAGAVRWYEGFDLSSYDRNVDFTKHKTLYWGNAASMLARMGGEFEGAGEYIQITQSTDPGIGSTLTISSDAGSAGSDTDMEAEAVSLFLGVQGEARLVRLIGYNSNGVKTRGSVTTAGTFEMAVSSQSGFSSYWLADTSGANGGLCYFTRLSGDFNGTGESATIKEESGMWKLSVTAGGGSSAYARARCMAYDQR
jgi:hypothetical protein